jgi:uncharacterized protein YigE (DUF2233 family)
MRIIFLLTLLLASICPQNQTKKQTQTLQYKQHSFDIYRVDINQQKIELFLKDSLQQKFGSIDAVKKQVEKQGKELVFATNAGMYLPHKNNDPQGLYIEKGVEHNPLNVGDTSAMLNFYMKPNGVFLGTPSSVKVIETSKYEAIAQTDSIVFATQSGPMLLIDGQIHPKFREFSKNIHIRSGVGIIDDTNLVFAISNERVNFYTFAMLFKEVLHCNNALYLDGAISEMYIPSLPRKQLGGNFGAIIGICAPNK